MNRSTIWIVIILAIIIVAGGIYYFILNSSNTNSSNQNIPITNNSNTSNLNKNVNRALNTNTVNQNINTTVNGNSNSNANTNVSVNSNSNANSNANTNSSANTNTAASAKQVSVMSSGFSPNSVTITRGSTVTWTNNSSDTVYVAPDNHPSHTKYAGVWDDDGRGNIQPGETYSVTFSTTGTYTYHDHLNPTDTGTVIVQ